LWENNSNWGRPGAPAERGVPRLFKGEAVRKMIGLSQYSRKVRGEMREQSRDELMEIGSGKAKVPGGPVGYWGQPERVKAITGAALFFSVVSGSRSRSIARNYYLFRIY